MKQEKILAYKLRVDEKTGEIYKGYFEEIENTLRAKQDFVGGTIQCLHLTNEIDMVCNDDGKLMGLPLNRVWFYESQPIDVVMGNILCVRHEGDEFTSIREDDEPVILEQLRVCVAVDKDILVALPNDCLIEYPKRNQKR